jgi:hypothetical protein
MKAITILQPFAALIVAGAKKYETRSWDTSYRGKIAIHTGKNIPFERGTEFFEKAKGYLNGADIDKLPKGAIIAIADLAECYEVVMWNDGKGLESKLAVNPDGTVKRDASGHRIGCREKAYPEGDELIFGNLDVGMFAWETYSPCRNRSPTEETKGCGTCRMS